MSDRDVLREAFKELRKHGYTARMNFSCCQSCAWYELSKAGKDEKVVFWHNQDNQSFDRWGNLRCGLYLAWSGDQVEIARLLGSQFLNTRLALEIPRDETKRFVVYEADESS
jgi:hypothetical protein